MPGPRGGGHKAASDLMRDNYEDLGIDKNGGDDEGASELYPPPLNRVNNAGPMSAEDLFCMQKLEEVSRRFHASAYYLQHKDPKADIARYSDKYRVAASAGQRTVLECIDALGPSKDSYFTQELLDGLRGNRATARNGGGAASVLKRDTDEEVQAGGTAKRLRRRANSHTSHTLERLSQRERVAGPNSGLQVPAGKPRAGSIDSQAASIEEEEEVENDDDYGVDHYGDSGDEGGGDDDGGDDEPFY